MRRIEVCGGIASGKTTLANLLKSDFCSAILEEYERNPFLSEFYSSPADFAFETEITFLLQHYHQIKRASGANWFACDYSLFLDLAYSNATLKSSERAVFLSVLDHILGEIGSPQILVFLVCSAEAELERIRSRGRAVEKGVNLDYLKRLNASVEDTVRSLPSSTNLIEINSGDLNFANDENVRSEVRKMLSDCMLHSEK